MNNIRPTSPCDQISRRPDYNSYNPPSFTNEYHNSANRYQQGMPSVVVVDAAASALVHLNRGNEPGLTQDDSRKQQIRCYSVQNNAQQQPHHHGIQSEIRYRHRFTNEGPQPQQQGRRPQPVYYHQETPVDRSYAPQNNQQRFEEDQEWQRAHQHHHDIQQPQQQKYYDDKRQHRYNAPYDNNVGKEGFEGPNHHQYNNNTHNSYGAAATMMQHSNNNQQHHDDVNDSNHHQYHPETYLQARSIGYSSENNQNREMSFYYDDDQQQQQAISRTQGVAVFADNTGGGNQNHRPPYNNHNPQKNDFRNNQVPDEYRDNVQYHNIGSHHNHHQQISEHRRHHAAYSDAVDFSQNRAASYTRKKFEQLSSERDSPSSSSSHIVYSEHYRPNAGSSNSSSNNNNHRTGGKHYWLPHDDELLKHLAEQFGNRKWAKIAESFPGRTTKQCRDRWHNQLNPAIVKSAWTARENELLVEAHRELGNKWSLIAQMLPGRTPTAVKNRHRSICNRVNSSRTMEVERTES